MQSLSGIAKDLTKMSSKSAIKVLVPEEAKGALFKWVAILTGSKNALKGVGFFLGGFLLHVAGYAGSLRWMPAHSSSFGPAPVRAAAGYGTNQEEDRLPANLLKIAGDQPPLGCAIFSLRRAGYLVRGRGARFSRRHAEVELRPSGRLHGLWVIGYGIVQSFAPAFWRSHAPAGPAAAGTAFILAGVAAAVPLSLAAGIPPPAAIIGGLGLFGSSSPSIRRSIPT